MPKLDFAAINAAALAAFETLIAEWLPDGHAVGGEWKACNPTRGDTREGSFSINLRSGVWADFATDDKGKDPVSLYAYLFTHNEQGAAAREIAARLGMDDSVAGGTPQTRASRRQVTAGEAGNADKPGPGQPEAAPGDAPEEEKRRTPWQPVRPAPADAPAPPRAHEFRGLPEATWTYFDAEGRINGLVYRFRRSDGGKEVMPLTWARHAVNGREAWRWLSFDKPRPLYDLHALAAKPGATVLVVEGEKCADAAREALPELAVTTWPGGGKAVEHADFSPLAGRRVVIWPDCDAQREKLTPDEVAAGVAPESKPLLAEADQPGVKAARRIAAICHALGCEVSVMAIPAPGEKPGGWDVADAIAEGYAGAVLAAYVAEQARAWSPPVEGGKVVDLAARRAAKTISPPNEAGAGGGGGGGPPAGGDGPGGAGPPEDEDWQRGLLRKNRALVACVSNLYQILSHERDWAGVVAFDEFSQRTIKLRPPPWEGGGCGEWETLDDTQAAMWLTRRWRVAPSSVMVAETIEALARAQPVHPVRAWLSALPPWDGTERLGAWLSDCLGVTPSAYVTRVGRFFLMGMVARVFEPGVKFDYCLVLEGRQGKGKSTALRILGGEWFGDTDLDLHNKDSMSALRGKWLYEIAEMGAIARAESLKQKSFLSRQVDEYRPVYGRREIRAPRQLVFAGTTNEWEWQKDPTGGRRFWPVECDGEFRLDLLAQVREQLFAEALAAYRARVQFWPTAEEQRTLFDPEQLAREQSESLVDALHDWVEKQAQLFSVASALLDGLKLPANALTRDMQTRVGIALRKLGCTRVEKRNGMTRYWYKPPERAEVPGSKTTVAREGADYVPF